MKLYEKYLNEQDNVEIDEYLSDLEEAVFDLINSLDEDQFNEDQQDIIDDILELTEDDSEYIDEEINEVQRERVVRGGKKVRKLKRKPGYKVKNGRYVKISSSEKRKRSRGAKKGARKRKSQKSSIERKRKRSMKKR
jgi:hypothetical protein